MSTPNDQQLRGKIPRDNRHTIIGTAERPRLNVYKSNKHIYGSIINDRISKTLFTVSTLSENVKNAAEDKTRGEAARIVGNQLAEEADERGISQVVFDRSGHKYHGVIKELAEGAREGGLEF